MSSYRVESIFEETQGKNMKQKLWRNTCHRVVHSVLLKLCMYIYQICYKRMETQCTGPSHIDLQLRLTDMAIGPTDGDNYLIEVPSSQVTVDCIRLTMKSNQNINFTVSLRILFGVGSHFCDTKQIKTK